jgi:hypothetical protein
MAQSVPASGVQAHRVIFIDLGRFVALVFMLYGHTVSALLAPEYQRGTWFDVWQFQRGLTSSLFLLLAGFAFSVATSRHWAAHRGYSPALIRRVRRFGFFILLGYALHLPVGRLVQLPSATPAQWQSFLAVDVLQLIGVAFLGLQALVLATRSRWAFTAAGSVLAVAAVSLTPWVWDVEWAGTMPAGLAAYLSPATGSLFPLFPFGAYVLSGAVLGQLYAECGAARLPAFANAALLGPGIVLVLTAVGLSSGVVPSGHVVVQVVMRTGASLVLVGAIAHASQRLARLPRFFGAVAQETLLIYFVHLCIVYGSIWNSGLRQALGASLGPRETLMCVVVLLASMAGLGWAWHGLKHARPRVAQWARVAVGIVLVARLL